jgi:Tyrosyl-DNA phosphodiesterase
VKRTLTFNGSRFHSLKEINCDIFFLFLDSDKSHPKFGLLSSFGIDYEWIMRILQTTDLVFVDHSEPEIPGITKVVPKLGRFGSMHAKIMLLEFENFTRMVISSANLTEFDYTRIDQIFWVCDFHHKTEEEYLQIELSPKNRFESDLRSFLAALLGTAKETTKIKVNSVLAKTMITVNSLVHLIPSIPCEFGGYPRIGHLAVKWALAQSRASKSPVTYESVSSVGMIYENWITNELMESFQATEFEVQWPGYEDVCFEEENGILHFNQPKPEVFQMFFRRKDPPVSVQDSPFKVSHAKVLIGQNWTYGGSHNLSQPAWGVFRRNKFCCSSFELGILILNTDNHSVSQVHPYQTFTPFSKEILEAVTFYPKPHKKHKIDDSFVGPPPSITGQYFGHFLRKVTTGKAAVYVSSTPITLEIRENILAVLPGRIPAYFVESAGSFHEQHVCMLFGNQPGLYIAEIENKEILRIVDKYV